MKRFNPGIKILILIEMAVLPAFLTYAETAEDYFKHGVTDARQRNYGQAIIDFTESIEINPNYANAYVNRGNAYDHQGDFARAVLDYTKALEINPKDADIYYNRGIVYFYKKDFVKAWDDVHKAESLGAKIDSKFLEALKEESSREK